MFWGMKLNLFCMLMYLGMFVPTVGWLAPIIMWATNKDQDASKMIDQHGRNIFNFLISMVIYGFVAFVLSLVTLGIGAFVLYPALGIYAIVVIILSALKANEGQIKPIPLCIRFIK